MKRVKWFVGAWLTVAAFCMISAWVFGDGPQGVTAFRFWTWVLALITAAPIAALFIGKGAD